MVNPILAFQSKITPQQTLSRHY